MDRFKFRVWRPKNIFVNFWKPQYIYFPLEMGEYGIVFTETDIIEQCTGLKDKNGKLIYENDLIKCPNGIYRIAVDDFGLWTAIYENNPLKDVVEWSDIVKNYAFNQNNVELEVLGNIHENADLLGEE